MSRLGRLAALGAATAAYSFYEPLRYRLEHTEADIAREIPEVTILHVSDTHMNAGDRRLQAFLDDLPNRLGTVPDLILSTGDLIEDDSGIEPVIAALNRLEARWGRFYVLGSHDYYQAVSPGYTKYFTGDRSTKKARPADTDRLERGLQEKGWVSLLNRTELVDVEGGSIRLAGVDDPYIQRHRTEHIAPRTDESLAIGLVHAPDVVSQWVLNGFDLVVAGHTHGGQVRLPGFGSVVTNCSLPIGLAAGLHRVGHSWLHVSRGLGTGRFSPIRFACTPEVTLIKLVPRLT